MKKRVINTVLYAIAILIFFFGNSVNVIHFCCDVCRVQGAQVFSEGVCHELESTDIQSFSDMNTSEKQDGLGSGSILDAQFPFHLTDKHEECSISRISIFLDDFRLLFFTFLLVLTGILFSGNYRVNLLAKRRTSIYSNTQPYSILLSGRQLLNRICILRN